MKILVVAGTPRVYIKQLAMVMEADESLGCIDGHDVAKLAKEGGHDVTVLTHDVARVPEGCTHVPYSTIDDLDARLRYLAKSVEWDGVLALADIQPYALEGVYTTNSDYSDEEAGQLQPTSLRMHKHDPWLRFSKDVFENPQRDVLEQMRADGFKKLLCFREWAPMESGNRLEQGYVQKMVDDLKATEIDLMLADPRHGTHIEAKLFSRRMSQSMDAKRMAIALVQACEVGSELSDPEAQLALSEAPNEVDIVVE